MVSKNIFIYAEPENGGDEIFSEMQSILQQAISVDKYELKRLTKGEAENENSRWISDCAALFVHNEGGEEKFDENIRRSFAKYFLDHSGNLVFMCNPDEGRDSVWFLKSISEYGSASWTHGGSPEDDWPRTVGTVFEKFSRGQSIPANLQASRIVRDDRYTDFSLGLVRGDSQMAFMYLMCEDGGSLVFVSGPTRKLHESKSGPVWKDVMRVLKIVGVEAMTPRSPDVVQQCRRDAPCFGNPHILIYAGPDDQSIVYEALAAVICPLVGNRYKVCQVKHEDIVSPVSPSPWWANCVALFVQNDAGHKKFDDDVQRALARFLLCSGKLVLFCNPDDGRESTWLLNAVAAATDPPSNKQWSAEIGKAFEKFVKNEPLPSNVQCVQVQKGDANADFFLGLVRASDGQTPYMYLRCDDGDTAVFVGAKVEEAIERSVPVWLEILRLVGLGNVEL